MAAGTINGFLIARFRMQPFVATLAMMTGARGLAKLISGGMKVQPAAQPWFQACRQDTPPFFRWMTEALPGIGIQPAALLFLIALVVMAVLVAKTRYGRALYAIGGNEEAARLSGLRVWQAKIFTYALCAGFAALAGIVNACRQDLGDPGGGRDLRAGCDRCRRHRRHEPCGRARRAGLYAAGRSDRRLYQQGSEP